VSAAAVLDPGLNDPGKSWFQVIASVLLGRVQLGWMHVRRVKWAVPFPSVAWCCYCPDVQSCAVPLCEFSVGRAKWAVPFPSVGWCCYCPDVQLCGVPLCEFSVGRAKWAVPFPSVGWCCYCPDVQLCAVPLCEFGVGLSCRDSLEATERVNGCECTLVSAVRWDCGSSSSSGTLLSVLTVEAGCAVCATHGQFEGF
jgi:hypothetical protein